MRSNNVSFVVVMIAVAAIGLYLLSELSSSTSTSTGFFGAPHHRASDVVDALSGP